MDADQQEVTLADEKRIVTAGIYKLFEAGTRWSATGNRVGSVIPLCACIRHRRCKSGTCVHIRLKGNSGGRTLEESSEVSNDIMVTTNQRRLL